MRIKHQMQQIMRLFSSVYVFLCLSSFHPSLSIDESFGFLPIRDDASIFYWLMRTSAGNETNDYKSFPLIIYLAGGPGDGSSGFSNLLEIGPVDLDGKSRDQTWLKYANLLFIDNPVGCGYSFVADEGKYTRNNSDISRDLVTVIKMFTEIHPEFKSIPAYLFGESYGGKMAASTAKEIHQQVSSGNMTFNLIGVGLADAWIDPIPTTKTWPDYLYTMSFIDQNEEDVLAGKISVIEEKWKSGKDVAQATFMWQDLFIHINQITYGVDLHNVYGKLYDWSKLDATMNSRQMRDRLRIPDNVTWNKQGSVVFKRLAADFLNPVTSDVEYLLRETEMKVVVYAGQLDLIVTMIGTEKWINELNWDGKEGFRKVKKQLVAKMIDDSPLVYLKEWGNLNLFYMLRAGHSVPSDQVDAATAMIRRVLGHV